ncbi:MAG: TCP-1/cpn60 chaperonin family protein [DPANN group archaeon]|nr:TCP-1/cpn60 chaperonin family protein [DPANN group archaeon]
MTQLTGQPVYILPEGAQRTLGKDAQRINILVARAVATAIKTTLGPKGMDKMLVDSIGDITITNDGATILEEMSIEHPIGKMLVEVAKTQDAETGDGTTTAVVIAGELLKKAEGLLDQDVHPTMIVRGYKSAEQKAQEILQEIAQPISIDDKEKLINVCTTTMASKGSIGHQKDHLSKIIVNAIIKVAEKRDGKAIVDKDYIKVEKKEGGMVTDSQLIEGIVVDKERVHSGMPQRVENARIALIDVALEIKDTETDAEIRITSPDQMQAFLEQEEKMLKDMVDKIVESKATVMFCQKGIDDMAQHYLAKAGVFAVRRVKKSDLDKLAKATGAKIVSSLKDLSDSDLGKAQTVEERKVSGEAMTFVEGCTNPKAVTVLIRGGTQHVIDEAERAVEDGIGSTTSALELGKIVSGGGAVEIEIAEQLRTFARQEGGRAQLGIEAFADALEIIPRTLAESAGMDSIDSIVELRNQHAKGNRNHGINVMAAKVEDMSAQNVIEAMKVKKQAISSAAEAAEMILKIDDIIATKASGGGMPPGGMPPDMGGMGM